eukprot:ANDGO_05973.mRNA.1 hypothetical protein
MKKLLGTLSPKQDSNHRTPAATPRRIFDITWSSDNILDSPHLQNAKRRPIAIDSHNFHGVRKSSSVTPSSKTVADMDHDFSSPSRSVGRIIHSGETFLQMLKNAAPIPSEIDSKNSDFAAGFAAMFVPIYLFPELSIPDQSSSSSSSSSSASTAVASRKRDVRSAAAPPKITSRKLKLCPGDFRHSHAIRIVKNLLECMNLNATDYAADMQSLSALYDAFVFLRTTMRDVALHCAKSILEFIDSAENSLVKVERHPTRRKSEIVPGGNDDGGTPDADPTEKPKTRNMKSDAIVRFCTSIAFRQFDELFLDAERLTKRLVSTYSLVEEARKDELVLEGKYTSAEANRMKSMREDLVRMKAEDEHFKTQELREASLASDTESIRCLYAFVRFKGGPLLGFQAWFQGAGLGKLANDLAIFNQLCA